jgi:hypothetical protein
MHWLRKAGYAKVRLLTGMGKRKDGENGLIEASREH